MPPTPLPTLVLIHGLFSSPMEFTLLSRILRSRGVAFECLEIPGYTSPATRTVSGWRNWIDAADAALDARFAPDEPIVLAGLCVGGMVAAELALRPRSQRVAGLVLMSPTFAYDGWAIGLRQRMRRLAYLLRIDRWITVREHEPFGVRNAKTRQWIMQELAERAASAAGPASLPLRAIRESERLYAHVASRLKGLDVPMLVLHARDDEISSIASVERVLADAAVPACLVVLEHSYHMITIDNDRQRVAHELADFVGAERTRPAPARPRDVPFAAPGRTAFTAREPVSARRPDPSLPDLWMPT
jgi:carboxylesterase